MCQCKLCPRQYVGITVIMLTGCNSNTTLDIKRCNKCITPTVIINQKQNNSFGVNNQSTSRFLKLKNTRYMMINISFYSDYCPNVLTS